MSTPRSLPFVTSDCPPDGETCPFISCTHHLAIVRIERDGKIVWHPQMRGAETLSEDDLESKLAGLAYGGCTLRAAAQGGINLERIAEVLDCSRQGSAQMEATAVAKFRVAALKLRLDFA